MTITLDASLATAESFAESYAITETSHTLADDVMLVVQDASFDYEKIVEYFNDCLMELAGEFLIPDLEKWDDIRTDLNVDHIRMPADFMKNLRYCHSITNNREIKVYGSLSQMYRLFSVLNLTGNVLGVCVTARNLYYQRIPSTVETLRINYYTFPERLLSRYDKPVCLPWHLAKMLLKAYACKEIFSILEDGMDGQQINTKTWEGRYRAAKEALDAFIGPQERIPQEISQEVDWNELG